MRCKVCGQAAIRLYRMKGYDLDRCGSCGFGQIDVSGEDLRAYYDSEYFNGAKVSFSQAPGQELLPSRRYWVDRFLARGAKSVLEIGPGAGGGIGRYLRRTRPDVAYEAIELSDYAAGHLRSEGFTIHSGSLADAIDACRGRFDAVIATEVIEHDPDPLGFARAVHDALAPGGACHFSTGNFASWRAWQKGAAWHYIDPPAHVSFFTPQSAKTLFGGAGFADVSVWRAGFAYIDLTLKTRLPGILLAAHALSLSTGMTISARKHHGVP